ncbi:MAG: rRNA maturation RNase YbeY [Anaerolineae bacterium]|nr:rRNA maturation RNase YbeY [Anaerolineae bacterium]
MFDITVQVESDYEALVDSDLVQRVAEAVFAAEGQPAAAGCSVVIMGAEGIQALNREYRDVDEPTDVLAFAALEGERLAWPEEEGLYLGDVLISYPTACAQAEERGETAAEELSLLIVHGCLHLMGYDHADEDERVRMWARQDEILEALRT